MSSVPLIRQSATSSTPGEPQLATSAQVIAGSDNTTAVTPSGFSAALAASTLVNSMIAGVKVIAFRGNAGGTIAAQTGTAVTFSSNPSTGTYVYNIAPGTFTTFVAMVGNVIDNGAQVTNHVQSANTTTTTITVQTVFAGALSSAVPFDIILVGY